MAAYNQWNTRCDSALDECDIKLIYLGSMKFLATYEGTMSMSDHNFLKEIWDAVTKQNKNVKQREKRLAKKNHAKGNRERCSQ